ncbi:PepSY domain-containing protein [Rossellomorea aquimaris]|uniref:PepSY domain-containing protein n=1 Tax=Rossellomorea aquimaris TaxID=189382 RepID=UPI0009FA3BE1|nr:PepSY domain-containing protein [Rossellomorea aquimaris]
MNKKQMIAGLTTIGLLSITGTAGAAALSETGTQSVAQNQITESQAKEIALKQIQGTVVKVELETDNGVQVYEVDVKTPTKLFEVKIDANTGKVLKVEKENNN